MVTIPAPTGFAPPVPLYPDDSAIAERLQEVLTARRAAATAARVRDLEALMTEQGKVADLELALADMTHQRDLALAREVTLATDRDHWRALSEWQEDVLAGRQRYITRLHDRYQRLRRARRQDRIHLVWSLLTTTALCLITIAIIMTGPLLNAIGWGV